jgi:hypothetical protein
MQNDQMNCTETNFVLCCHSDRATADLRDAPAVKSKEGTEPDASDAFSQRRDALDTQRRQQQ